jgi:hypothetical protein
LDPTTAALSDRLAAGDIAVAQIVELNPLVESGLSRTADSEVDGEAHPVIFEAVVLRLKRLPIPVGFNGLDGLSSGAFRA